MSPQTIVIKKYENRRLYDSTHSRYVNLDEVAQMVRDGRDVQVVDAVTGEDRTRAVLTQIVVEHAKDDHSAFPLDVLAPDGRRLRQGHQRGSAHLHAWRLRHVPERLSGRVPGRAAAWRADAAARGVSGPHRGDVEVDALKKRLEELESVVSGIKIEAGAAEAGARAEARRKSDQRRLIRSDSPRHRSAPRP